MSNLPSGLPEAISDGETLARFLNSASLYAASKQLVKPAAFLPVKNGESSVHRHEENNLSLLWATGENVLEMGRTLYGAATLKADQIRDVGLDVAANVPPPRHANIVGWNNSANLDDQKAKQKELASLLAQRAILILKT